ncbi:hypothetical protein L195_g056702, partial [Trifolium pratense]
RSESIIQLLAQHNGGGDENGLMLASCMSLCCVWCMFNQPQKEIKDAVLFACWKRTGTESGGKCNKRGGERDRDSRGGEVI